MWLIKENNVETVVLLSDKKVDGHIDIDLDVEMLESTGGRAPFLCLPKTEIAEQEGKGL